LRAEYGERLFGVQFINFHVLLCQRKDASTMQTRSGLVGAAQGQTRTSSNPGAFIISLDFELRWGTRDQHTPAGAPQLLNARDVVHRLLDAFHAKQVAATWATVGFLFAECREELQQFAPGLLPTYENSRLNPYVEPLGQDEQDDPLHFAPSLIRAIQSCPDQEIATHTFSHYYCLEPGQTAAQFNEDLGSACRIAQARGIQVRSIVFPRNQVNRQILEVLQQHRISSYRGTAKSWLHKASDFAEQRRPHKRALRLLDAYLPLTGTDVVEWPREVVPGVYEALASRYFRPYTSGLASLASRAIQRIKDGMEIAARTGKVYHLWFHPEDFGLFPDENLMLFGEVLDHYRQMRDRYGMRSLSMAQSLETSTQAGLAESELIYV
jgi:hypothetical protein